MKENSKNHQFMQAISKAARICMNGKSIFETATQCELAPSTVSTLSNGKKESSIISIAKFAEGSGVKTSHFIALAEEYLPEDFSLFEY